MSNTPACSGPFSRLLPLALGLLVIPGSTLLSMASVKPCDEEADPECEDSERGHISGRIIIPGAGSAASSSSTMSSSTMSSAPRDGRIMRALKKAAREVATDPVFQAERALLLQADQERRRRSVQKRAQHDAPRWGNSPASRRSGADSKARPQARWMPGHVILRSEEVMRTRSRDFEALLQPALAAGQSITIGLCNTDHMCLAKVTASDGKPLDAAATAAAAETLSQVDGMRWASVNRFSNMSLVPNDDFYSYQWHYGAMNLEAAWDITTGDPDVTVVVVDTGLLTDHPDLSPRYAGGADLISEPSISNDGDGRDDNPYDPGDNACGQGCHSYHGSHVAGTVAAATNNASNVAGVTWAGRLLSARVLGQGGQGLNFDIIGGIFWAIGENVDGVAVNPTPADVINLSLGGPGTDPGQDEAVQAAIASGAIVIVAAGNEDADASTVSPANSPGSIVVAAVGNGAGGTPYRAPYSNYGDLVTVAAPGGDLSVDNDQDGQPDGVLSTMGDEVDFQQGTSMAAPHVSGLAMLMKSLSRNVSQEEVRVLLRENANSDVDCVAGCGAGLVDAARTLLDLEGRANEALVVASPSTLRLGKAETSAELTLKNVGGATTEVTVAVSGPGRTQVTIAGGEGSLGAGAERTVQVAINRGDDDQGEATLIFGWGGDQSSEARVIWNADEILVAEVVGVFALSFPDNPDDEVTVERAVPALRSDNFEYKLFNLTPGNYIVAAVADDNNDGDFDPSTESLGVFPNLNSPVEIEVEEGLNITDVDFVVAPNFDGQEIDEGDGNSPLGGACLIDSDCVLGMFCDTALPAGYCTQDCSASACPGDGRCFDFCGGPNCEMNFTQCLDGCTGDGDCRVGDGYVCDVDDTCYPG